jgi:hypothetical protein
MAQADAIPGYMELQQPRVFEKDSIVATIKPGIISRGQLVVLQFIKDSFPERPIYFSSRATPDGLGLGGHILTQGLAQKLVMRSPVPSADTVSTPIGILDVARTRALWTSVYRGPTALIREGQWVDRASVGIPYHYVLVGYYLAAQLEHQGDQTQAARVLLQVQQMARASGLDRQQGS